MIHWSGCSKPSDVVSDSFGYELASSNFNGWISWQRNLELLKRFEALPPKLLIFHTSRCGSTLAAKLLGQSPENRVFSEPRVLNAQFYQSPEKKNPFLVDLIRTLGLGASPPQKHLILKLPSYALLHAEPLREAFPEATFWLLSRDPLETLVSSMETPPKFLKTEEPLLDTHLSYLEKIYSQAAASLDLMDRTVLYSPDLAAILSACSDWCPPETDFTSATTTHSKYPKQTFRPDGQSKRERATFLQREGAHLRLASHFEAIKKAAD